jgi:Fe2+ transport system protein FeoA
MANVKSILTEIANSNLSVEDLRMINSFVVDQIKSQRDLENRIAKVSLKEGMKVRVNHPKLAGKDLVLVSVKRTKGHVREWGTDTNPFRLGTYVVPMSLIEAAI